MKKIGYLLILLLMISGCTQLGPTGLAVADLSFQEEEEEENTTQPIENSQDTPTQKHITVSVNVVTG